MKVDELRALIEQGEGQRLDFKRGVPSVKDLARMVICFANAEGGRLLLGVNDEGDVVGCRSYDIPHLLSSIYRVTEPSLTVDVEEVDTPQGTVLVVSVPRTPFVHATSGGVYRKRVGRECLPMSPQDVIAQQAERATLDYSASPLSQARYPDDLDPQALDRLRAELALRSPALSRQSDQDLLRSLRLLVDDADKQRPVDGASGEGPRLTVAGGLLLGRTETLRRNLPQSEVAYFRQQTDTDIRLSERFYLPLPMLLDRLEAILSRFSYRVSAFWQGLT